MCGRFTITITKEQLLNLVKKEYEIDSLEDAFVLPNYNVSPGSEIISIINDGNKHRIGTLKWGFMPPFKLETNLNIINVRSETVFTKPMFKNAIMKNRCIILADSFYEWRKSDKQPMRITLDKGKIFSMAGIWSSYIDDMTGEKINTVSIMTNDSVGIMKNIHHRMPVVLDKEAEKIWLSPYSGKDELENLLLPRDLGIEFYPVSKAVNSSRVNNSSLIEKAEIEKTLFDI